MSESSSMIQSYGLSLPVLVVVSAFSGIAWYNCISLFVRIWTTFKKYNSVYFWSLVVCSISTFLMPTAFLLKDFEAANINALEVLATVTWYGMVTGQSIVLYSRLHLVVVNRRKIRWVLYMIIFNAIIFHIPTTALTYASHNPELAPKFNPIYAIYEKIQLTGFSIQECIISGLYLWETRRILKTKAYLYKEEARGVMRHLIAINIFIVFLDLCLLATEYANLYQVQTIFKPAVYSIKLDLEFSILNQLRTVALANRNLTSVVQSNHSMTAPERDNIDMNMQKPTASESNLSTSDLVDRGQSTPNHGIVKVTEISVDRSAPFGNNDPEKDSIERHYRYADTGRK